MGRVAQNRTARPASSPLGGSSMPTIAIAIAAAAVALLIPQAAAAATAGGLPWESTFQTVANSMTGPVVQYGSVGAIAGTGLGVAFSDAGAVVQKVIKGAFGLSCAAGAGSLRSEEPTSELQSLMR